MNNTSMGMGAMGGMGGGMNPMMMGMDPTMMGMGQGMPSMMVSFQYSTPLQLTTGLARMRLTCSCVAAAGYGNAWNGHGYGRWYGWDGHGWWDGPNIRRCHGRSYGRW